MSSVQHDSSGSLAFKSLINLSWLTVTQYALMAIGFGVSILLARLLSPTDFGTVALASSISDIVFTLLAGWGFSLTLLQDQGHTPDLESSAFALTCLISLGVTVLSIPIAVAVGYFYQDNRVGIVFYIFIIGNSLQLFAAYWGALLERVLDYRRRESVNFVAQGLGMASGILMAMNGWGFWSLTLPTLIMNATLLIGLGACTRFRASFRLKRAAIERLFHMGTRWLVSQWLEFAFTRFDNLAVGSFAGRQELGYYNRAYNTAELGLRAAIPFASTYPTSLYSKLQLDRQRLSTAFQYLSIVIIAFGSIFALCWLMLPVPFVAFFYGKQWLSIVSFLQVFSIHAFLRPLVLHATALVYAKGMPGKIVKIKAIQFAIFVPTLLFAVSQSIEYVPWAVGINQLIGLVLTYREVSRWVDMNWKRYWLVPIGGIATGIVAVRTLLPTLGQWPPLIQLIVGGLIIGGCILFFLLLFERHMVLQGWKMIKSRGGMMARPSASDHQG